LRSCPKLYNKGTACPSTIYAIKKGTVPVGASVALIGPAGDGARLEGLLPAVQAWRSRLQRQRRYSGIFVYDAANTVKAGDRVTLTSATVTDYYGQIELTGR